VASTPESKVKALIKQLLVLHGAYYVMPVSNGMGRHGVPDFMVCAYGRFIGIEAKTVGKYPTDLQMSNLRQLDETGGIALVINETNLHELDGVLHVLKINGTPRSNYRLFERPQEADEPGSGPTVKRRRA
jgi:hypothetical protein